MAYLLGDLNDPRDEGRRVPNKSVSEEELHNIGVKLARVDLDLPSDKYDFKLKDIGEDWNMTNHDCVAINRTSMPDFDNKLKMFFAEHLHNDPELRLVTQGTGYFDVRNKENDWIRIPVSRGQIVFIPLGLYHRFTTDWNEDVRAVRFFSSEPKWEAHYREDDGEQQPARKEYLEQIKC